MLRYKIKMVNFCFVWFMAEFPPPPPPLHHTRTHPFLNLLKSVDSWQSMRQTIAHSGLRELCEPSSATFHALVAWPRFSRVTIVGVHVVGCACAILWLDKKKFGNLTSACNKIGQKWHLIFDCKSETIRKSTSPITCVLSCFSRGRAVNNFTDFQFGSGASPREQSSSQPQRPAAIFPPQLKNFFRPHGPPHR